MAAYVLLSLFLIVVLANAWLRERARRRRTTLFGGRHPVRRVRLADFDPVFAETAYGPSLEAAVTYVGRADKGPVGGTTDKEAWILAVLAKRANTLMEFGTCTGKTAWLWAVNSPSDAKIVTLTLAPEEAAQIVDRSDSTRATSDAIRESAFTRFLYSGTDVAAKVDQRFGDSKAFDETPLIGRADLIFVDGSHAYSYVRSDSAKAIAMCAPGGVVLWHDYDPGNRDVYRALNELSRDIDLVNLADTTLVAWRRPAAG